MDLSSRKVCDHSSEVLWRSIFTDGSDGRDPRSRNRENALLSLSEPITHTLVLQSISKKVSGKSSSEHGFGGKVL